MKKLIVASLVIISISSPVSARMKDMVGGPDANAQTIHHCGMLPMSSNNYTSSQAVTRVVERKLMALGYLSGNANGVYDKKDKQSVRRFQKDHGMKATGVVDAPTAQRLAYSANKNPNVQKCFGVASSR